MSARTIVLTDHVEERAPGLTPWTVRREVADAIEAGRVSPSRPWFLEGNTPARGDRWFVWPPSQTHAYVVKFNSDRTVVVITCLPAERDHWDPAQGPTAISRAFQRAHAA